MMTLPNAGDELTHILVVSDVGRSPAWYRDILGAEPYREYGGTSAVFRFQGAWLLLVTGGGPTPDKPSVTFAPPSDPNTIDQAFTIRVQDCQAPCNTLRARAAVFLTPPLASAWEGRVRRRGRESPPR
jgi:hypothetical protein